MEMKKLDFTDRWDIPSDPMTLLKMKVKGYNELTGDLKGYDCSKCRNRGKIAEINEDGKLVFYECSCMKIRKSLSLADASGFGKNILKMRFENFEAKEPWQIQILEAARAYGENPEGWFLLCGQSGSGKTHICTAIGGRQLHKGHEVQYLSWRDEISSLKSIGEPEQRQKRMEKIKTAEMLCVDDLFKGGGGMDNGQPTAADVNTAFEILNYRYNNDLPTVISTEKSPQVLEKIDEALACRILESAGDNTFYIRKNPARNYRMRGCGAAPRS